MTTSVSDEQLDVTLSFPQGVGVGEGVGVGTTAVSAAATGGVGGGVEGMVQPPSPPLLQPRFEVDLASVASALPQRLQHVTSRRGDAPQDVLTAPGTATPSLCPDTPRTSNGMAAGFSELEVLDHVSSGPGGAVGPRGLGAVNSGVNVSGTHAGSDLGEVQVAVPDHSVGGGPTTGRLRSSAAGGGGLGRLGGGKPAQKASADSGGGAQGGDGGGGGGGAWGGAGDGLGGADSESCDESMSGSSEQGVCAICMELPMAVVVSPCQHGLCVQCALQLTVKGREAPSCPFCRCSIAAFDHRGGGAGAVSFARSRR